MEKDYNLYENILKGYGSSLPFLTGSSLSLDPTKIIYGSPISDNQKMQLISIDIDKLLETSDSAANTALRF
jgi:hypothetical protein